MFGYVITNCKTLSEGERQRLRALYCGMCRTLKQRYGHIGRFALSYDMTFLALVLSALYEPEEATGVEKCLPHPVKAHPYAVTEMSAYAADINVALAYHKCADNWQDDHNVAYAAARGALSGAYKKAFERIPEKCRAIEKWMSDIRALEADGCEELDPPMNLTGELMGKLFQYDPNDYFAAQLYDMGAGLGRFIYFMDAYDDLDSDIRHKRFNPLKGLRRQDDFEALCKSGLTMMMADCAEAFERLPIVKDADLIRNILYSGVWARYGYIQSKLAEGKGAQ